MKFICFSKLLKELPIDRLSEAVRSAGGDGVDLCVRDGYPVNPGNARAEMPAAVKRMREAGLEVPLVSASTGLTNPADPVSETLFRACHDAGVPNLKVGYWGFKGGDYWKQIDAVRKDVEGFEKLAQRYGVRICLHTHSGPNIGLNVSSLMEIVRGSNPSAVGAYLDPGHLALCGEPPAMAVKMAGEHLHMVAIKDSVWEKSGGGQPRRSRFLPVGNGMVEWAEWMKSLKANGYAGPLSFHSEYEGLATEALLAQTKRDIAFMRGVCQAAGL